MSDALPLLAGSLAAVSLPALVQLADAEQLTGRLSLGEAGSLDFAAGQLVAARCGARTGVDAALELFLEAPDRFVLTAQPGLAGQPIGDAVGLVMEGCRLADEWPRLADRALRPVPGAPLRDALRPLVGAGRTVADAVRAAGVARVRVIDALLAAHEAGEIELGDPPPVEVVPDYHEALDAGRAAVRRGALDEAATAFAAALRARPGDAVARQNLARTRALAAQAGAAPFPSTGRGAA